MQTKFYTIKHSSGAKEEYYRLPVGTTYSFSEPGLRTVVVCGLNLSECRRKVNKYRSATNKKLFPLN